MATITDQDINDLVTGTLRRLGRLRFNQIATKYQNYEVMGRLMKRDKVQFDDGIGIRRTLMVDLSNAAKMVGLFEPDAINIGTVLQTIQLDWRRTTSNYAYERRELLENRGISRIVDIIKVRRTDCLISLAELMEDQFWEAPPSAADKLHVHGVPYWVTFNTTGGSGGTVGDQGFFGNDLFAGGTAGLSSTTFPTWANYYGHYGSIDKSLANSVIPQMRTAYRQIRFKSPVDTPDFRQGTGDQYRIYTNEPVMQRFENIGEGQNENLGRDLASMDGVMTFRRNPIVWVPQLDNRATDPTSCVAGTNDFPIYMLNFGYFNPVFLKGDYLRETEPRSVDGQHNAWAIHIDTSWNVLCTDRRCQATFTCQAGNIDT